MKKVNALETHFRTNTCGELDGKSVGKKVKLAGWVHTRRDHGGIIFIDLRDRYGITQIVFEPQNKKLFIEADKLRREYCVHVKGKIRKRPKGMENPKLITGDIEILVEELEILNKSEVPPFEIDARFEVSEDVRLKYRFLDLRNRKLQENIIFRSKVIKEIRDWMFKQGFVEIETPLLTVSSPEGARDFLVPSRIHPGKFYALPQAPQQYKQLLMVAGFDKYFQIAPCMRDEDARADRSPGEFYQLDVETSFLTQDEFFALMEPLFIYLTDKFSKKKILKVPFPRIPYKESMLKYGTDKPDLRFGLEIKDLTDSLKSCGFEVFENIVKSKGIIRALTAEKAANFSRKEFDEFLEMAKEFGLGGLAYITLKDKEIKSPLTKFIKDTKIKEIIKEMKAKEGDVIFFAAGPEKNVCRTMGELRIRLGKKLNIINDKVYAYTWIVDFPMYEYNDEAGKIDFLHNPFSMPQGGLEALEKKEPTTILAYQYDIVCNGMELSSGAVRNNIPEIMYKAFEVAGYDEKAVDKKFGHMINAFKYGAPPHCGFAPGIERLIMLLKDESNIREVTAFPKNKTAQDVMMGAPSEVDEKQLKELGIKLDVVKK